MVENYKNTNNYIIYVVVNKSDAIELHPSQTISFNKSNEIQIFNSEEEMNAVGFYLKNTLEKTIEGIRNTDED